jgi:hypothetical protein
VWWWWTWHGYRTIQQQWYDTGYCSRHLSHLTRAALLGYCLTALRHLPSTNVVVAGATNYTADCGRVVALKQRARYTQVY